MRSLVAPSLFLSIVRRSQGLNVVSSSCRCRMAAVSNSSGTSPALPLGVDPNNCKVVELREQIRLRYEKTVIYSLLAYACAAVISPVFVADMCCCTTGGNATATGAGTDDITSTICTNVIDHSGLIPRSIIVVAADFAILEFAPTVRTTF